MNYNPKAVCGHCGQIFEEHKFDTDRFGDLMVYCYSHTNGDLWDDMPQEEEFYLYVENEYPLLFKKLVKKWQKTNGHE